MPRSSRSKSHKQSKQSKHSSKETTGARESEKEREREREYSGGSDEEVKIKERSSNGNGAGNGGGGKAREDVVVSVVKVRKDCLVSGEKMKHSKDGFNGYVNGGGESDRWNGGRSDGDEKGLVVVVDDKEELIKAKVFSKSGGEARSKSGRRYDRESDEKGLVLVDVDDKEELIKVKGVSKGGVQGRSRSGRRYDGESDEKGLVVDVDDTEGLIKAKAFSKSGRRHDGESGSGSGVVLEKDEGKSGSRSEKRKLEKEVGRKESGYKEHKGSKEKERGSDKGRKGYSEKVGEETLEKQVEDPSRKRGKEIIEWPIEEELRNPELEKELAKRMRRRGEASNEKVKYQDDIKETEDRRLSTRSDRSKDERHKNEEYADVKETRQKDEKHREDSEHDKKNRDIKHRGESERYSKHRDDKYDKYREDKYSEDGNKESKYKDDKYVDICDKDERSRDGKHRQDDDRDYRYKEEKRARDSKYGDVPEAKRLRDDNEGTDSHHRKTSKRDASPVYDDRVARYKDDKDKRGGSEKDESSVYKLRSSMKEQRSELDKRSSVKDELVSERGRLDSRNADVEITTSSSRRRSPPSGSSYPSRDHHRVSKHEESKYRDNAYEDRARHSVHANRGYNSAHEQSDKKVISKDNSYMGGDLLSEKRMRPESRSSPQVDKSPSSSNERRNLIKSDVRKNIDLEESGPGLRSGGSKDTSKDGKGSRELVNEAQIDNDNLSVSSPYSRNSHFTGNLKSHLPPPSPSTFRTGSDSPYMGSTEDERSKSNNRHRRMVDQNMYRGQNHNHNHNQNQHQNQSNWKNVSNWPPPMANGGYIPFQHVPPPMFHPLMQQFPPPMFGRPPLIPGLPFHPADHGRPLGWGNQVDESGPPSLHGWDANNSVFGDEAHLYGRADWDRRSQLNNQGWDQSGEMWKGQNAGSSMEMQPGQQKDEYIQNDESLSGATGQPDESEPNQLDIQPETLNLDKKVPEAQKPTGSPKIFEVVKEDTNALITQAYLSRVDVSKDLTQSELYDQYISMMDLDQEEFAQPLELDCKILYLEESVDVIDSASLFAAINDSVFKKAMFLYKKQKEELQSTETDKEKVGSDDDGKPEGEVVAAEDIVMEDNKDNNGPPNKHEEPMDMEVDHSVVKQEVHESTLAEVKESLAPSASGGLLPCKVEDATTDDGKIDGGGDSLVLSDVSTAEVAVMPTESIEFESVNLNRIHHHSPESTH